MKILNFLSFLKQEAILVAGSKNKANFHSFMGEKGRTKNGKNLDVYPLASTRENVSLLRINKTDRYYSSSPDRLIVPQKGKLTEFVMTNYNNITQCNARV